MSNEIMRKLADAYKKVNESKFVIPEDIPVDERDMFMAKAAAAHKAGQSHFTMNGKKHPVTMKKDTANAVNSSTNEAKDLDKTNADKAIQHDCATHVEHSKWGKGNPISGMHTIVETSPGQGYVTHYDIVFEHGIEKNVSVDDLTIISEMSHGHSKKKKNEMSSKEKMKRGLYNAMDAKSADKKPEDYIDPNDGKKKVRMVPVDKQIVDKDKEMKKESTGFEIYDRIQEKHAGIDAMKKAGNAKADAEADERKPSENKKMALQKALQKSAAPSEKGRKAVTLPKAPFDIPKAKAGEEDTAKANPKLEKNKKEDGVVEGSNQELEMHTDYARPNSVNAMREAMQQMWQEAADREAHYKGATKPDGMKDNRKGKGAQDMMAPADAAAADPDKTVEKGMDDVAKAGRAGPSMKARRNDNMKGDKNIINKIGRTT